MVTEGMHSEILTGDIYALKMVAVARFWQIERQ